MPRVYKPRGSSDSITVRSIHYARAVLAAQRMNMQVNEWVEQAILEKEARENDEHMALAYREECELAAHERRPTPLRPEFVKNYSR